LAKSELPSFSKQLTINEVSRRSGVASSALRFYETRGLIRSERAGSGHRRYSRAVLRRIAFIVFAQRIGLTPNEVAAELAKLPADRVPERADWSTCRARGVAELMSALPNFNG
jgi:MerR family transcriptional regulator, redox-sensitive transcriptional activator SoxR